ncbi:MAG: superoxide dismutase [Alistipes sp.]
MTTDSTTTRFQVRELPYAYEALTPQISEETLRFHYGKHYTGYVAKLNELVLDTPFADMPIEDIIATADGPIFNNAAQAWNHEFYFEALSPTPQNAPKGKFSEAINRHFGSFEAMKEQMSKACLSLFGSGWVWLVEDRLGNLSVVSESNAGNPIRYGMRPLFCIDVWEHAYYIDYRNVRADAVRALWSLVDWKTVEARYNEK